jgi:hypothetical protein
MNTQKKTAPRAATPETDSNKNITINSITDDSEKIKVVAQNPGEISRIVTIPNTLEALEELVGGYIEPHHICGSLVLVMDEDGRLKGLPENVRCVQYGTIVGPVFITADKDEDFRSLTTEEIQAARAWLMDHSI